MIDFKKHFITFISLILLLSACKKEEIELLTQEVDSHTNYQLHDVFFVDDSTGYICGGSKYAIGIFLKTKDGGKTWSVPDSIFPKCAYANFFFNAQEGFVVGYDSWTGYTNDTAKTFVTGTDIYSPTNAVAYTDRLHGVKVGGDGYANGYISATVDGGLNWTSTLYPNNFMAVEFADNTTAFASGFGVIYKSNNAGQTFNPLDVRGDFFMDMHFATPQVGYFAGYQGVILKTSDGGNSFKKIRAGNQPFSKRVHFETIEFWDTNIGYAAGDNGYLIKTENGGDTWKTVKQFTSSNLRSIHFFSATSGVIVGDNGKIFLFNG